MIMIIFIKYELHGVFINKFTPIFGFKQYKFIII